MVFMVAFFYAVCECFLALQVTKTFSKKNSTCLLVGRFSDWASRLTFSTSSLGSQTANSSFCSFGDGDVIFRREDGLASGMGQNLFYESCDCQPTGFRCFADPCRQGARDVESDHFLVW
jgi:hypothetical protein